MNITKLFMLLLLAASMGLVVSCDSDSSSNAQDTVEEVSCPCNFDQDFWTELGWMVAKGGNAFDTCLSNSSKNLLSLQGANTMNADGGVLSLECEAAITTDTDQTFGETTCDGQVICTASDTNESKDIMQTVYFDQEKLNEDQLTACQNDIEAIAMALGISCGN